MDKIDRYQFLRDKNKRVLPSKRVPVDDDFDIENTWVEKREKISLHNYISGKLKSKEFWDDYLRSILRRTIIAVSLLLVVQVWNVSKIKIGNTDASKVKEVVTFHYTWDHVKEIFNTIDYDKIVEVWNDQGSIK